MKQQTSVEWLVDEIEKHYITNIGTLDPTIVIELRRQAKAMENEQYYESYRAGNSFLNSDSLDFKDFFDEFYYKTYGGNK